MTCSEPSDLKQKNLDTLNLLSKLQSTISSQGKVMILRSLWINKFKTKENIWQVRSSNNTKRNFR